MSLTTGLKALKEKRIDKKDFIIVVLISVLVLMAFFGWYYFRAQKNPLDLSSVSINSEYKHLFSIYDPQNFKRPTSVAVSPWGDVLATDSVNHKIVVFDRNGQFKKTLGGPGEGAGQFNYPISVAVSGDKIYVADFYNKRIQVLDQDGKQLSVLPAPADQKQLGPVVMPVTLTTDSQGNLYVSDISVQRILVFDATGRLQKSFGQAGAKPGELSYVNGITVDVGGEGRIYLANSNNCRIDEYSMEGKFIKTVSRPQALLNPKGITYDQKAKELWVADIFAHKIVGINAAGNVVEVLGERGLDANGFNFPTGVVWDDSGRLYIADRENNRVEVYSR